MNSLSKKSIKIALFRWLLEHSNEEYLAAYIPLLSKWLNEYGTINEAWVKPTLYSLFQENGFHFVRNHYYGVLPDTSKLSKSWWEQPAYEYAYNLIPKVANSEEVFERVMSWSEDLQGIPREQADGFYWNNPMLPPLDAIVLYGMIREYKPRNLVEVGSGFSTEIALLAAQHTKTSIHSIEPYPSARLLAHKNQLHALTQVPLQEIDFEVFDNLQANDFLFIDTTHTVKINSDVNHFVFNVFPRLAPGVIVHIHDIFLPHEYPQRWYDEISIFWNEQYLLLAYLMENPAFELLLPNFSLSLSHKDSLRARLGKFDIWNLTANLGNASGASFWLRKR